MDCFQFATCPTWTIQVKDDKLHPMEKSIQRCAGWNVQSLTRKMDGEINIQQIICHLCHHNSIYIIVITTRKQLPLAVQPIQNQFFRTRLHLPNALSLVYFFLRIAVIMPAYPDLASATLPPRICWGVFYVEDSFTVRNFRLLFLASASFVLKESQGGSVAWRGVGSLSFVTSSVTVVVTMDEE